MEHLLLDEDHQYVDQLEHQDDRPDLELDDAHQEVAELGDQLHSLDDLEVAELGDHSSSLEDVVVAVHHQLAPQHLDVALDALLLVHLVRQCELEQALVQQRDYEQPSVRHPQLAQLVFQLLALEKLLAPWMREVEVRLFP